MSNEEFERKMAFIVEQQAQFASDIQQLREVQAQTEQLVARLAAGTLEGFKDVNAKINALVDSQIHLNESQSRTDESLRSLIAVVDRYFSNGRRWRWGIWRTFPLLFPKAIQQSACSRRLYSMLPKIIPRDVAWMPALGAAEAQRYAAAWVSGKIRWMVRVDFEIVGEITGVETIAIGTSVRDRARLRKQYGRGKWRKVKGFAKVRLPRGTIRLAEIHWYEAHGIGKKEFKLKLPFLD